MSNTFIFGTNIIRQDLRFLANEYHRHHGDDHVIVETLYRVSCEPDGSGGTEWLLTRFHDKQGKARSAILRVCHIGIDKMLAEYYSCPRNLEKAMIEEWKAFVEEEDDG
jgi:hypothetical protein